MDELKNVRLGCFPQLTVHRYCAWASARRRRLPSASAASRAAFASFVSFAALADAAGFSVFEAATAEVPFPVADALVGAAVVVLGVDCSAAADAVATLSPVTPLVIGSYTNSPRPKCTCLSSLPRVA